MAFHLSLLHPRRLHPVADTVAGQTTKYKVLHPVLQCLLVCYSVLHPVLHPSVDTVVGQTTKYKVLHPVLQCPLVCYSVLHPVLHPSVDTVVGQTTKYKPCHSHEAGTLEEIKEQTSKIEHLPFQYPHSKHVTK